MADVDLIDFTTHNVTVPSPLIDLQRALDETQLV